jgi:hypothetical protein
MNSIFQSMIIKQTNGLTLSSLLFLITFGASCVSYANDDTSTDEISDPMLHGETIHKNHCYKCHTDQVYTRENRFVKSLDALSQQVVRCKDSNNIPWFEEDTDTVVQFLNNKYYRF